MKTKTKGLEPIVAAVLLIVVAVIGAVLIYLWFAGFVTKATSQAEQAAVSEKLKIEGAILEDDGDAKLYVRNLSGDTVRLVSAYLMRPGSTAPVCDPVDSTSITPNTIDPNTVEEVDIDFPTGAGACDIVGGYDYVVKIITVRGTEFAVTVTAIDVP